MAYIAPEKRQLAMDMHKFKGTGIRFSMRNLETFLACLQDKSSIVGSLRP